RTRSAPRYALATQTMLVTAAIHSSALPQRRRRRLEVSVGVFIAAPSSRASGRVRRRPIIHPPGRPPDCRTARAAAYTPAMASILVFGPHPDDAELGMGGTIIKLARQGHTVHIVDMTTG